MLWVICLSYDIHQDSMVKSLIELSSISILEYTIAWHDSYVRRLSSTDKWQNIFIETIDIVSQTIINMVQCLYDFYSQISISKYISKIIKIIQQRHASHNSFSMRIFILIIRTDTCHSNDKNSSIRFCSNWTISDVIF